MILWNFSRTNDLWQDLLGLRSAGVKYEDAQCDSYTHRGRSRS